MSVSSIWECVCVCADLGDAVMLYVDDSRHGHLHTAKHSHHLQLLIIKWRSPKILHKQIQHEKRLFNGLYCTISHWYPTMNIFSFWKWTVQCFISISHHHTSPFPSTYSTPVYILLPWYVQLVALTNLIVFQKWWWKWIDGLMTGCKCGWCILKALFAAINRPGCYVLAAQRFEMRRW